LVEQKTLNLFVEGSNPSGGTKQTQGFAVNWGNSQKTILATSWPLSNFCFRLGQLWVGPLFGLYSC